MTEEQWKVNVSRGHVPFRRDCLTCVAGAGVGRRHGRVEHPDAFVLTADTSGPLKTPGMDSHQRGAKKSMRYLFVARLRLPSAFLKEAGCPLKGEPVEEEETKGEDEDPFAEDEDLERRPHSADPEEESDCGIPFPSDGEEEGEPRDEPPSGSADGVEPLASKEDEVPPKMDDLQPPEMTSLVWTAALPVNKSPTVLEAIQDVFYHARSRNIPILRFHSDKSMEFYAKGGGGSR